MRNVLASALIFLAACTSTRTDRPADVAQPGIRVSQAGPIFFGSGSTAGVTVNVEVTNRANVPLILREVEIGSSDAEQYRLAPARRLFDETIAPGETRTVQLSATAVATSNVSSPLGQPLNVRAFVRFEANGKRFREAVIAQFPSIP